MTYRTDTYHVGDSIEPIDDLTPKGATDLTRGKKYTVLRVRNNSEDPPLWKEVYQSDADRSGHLNLVWITDDSGKEIWYSGFWFKPVTPYPLLP